MPAIRDAPHGPAAPTLASIVKMALRDHVSHNRVVRPLQAVGAPFFIDLRPIAVRAFHFVHDFYLQKSLNRVGANSV
jgi:hypothetical protein